MEYSQVFDIVKFEKANTIARFNMFLRIAKSRHILEAVVLLGLISWSTALFPAAAKMVAGKVVRFSAYIFNHHFIFLIGNAIIALLFFMCRRNDGASSAASSAAGDLYEDYVNHREAAIHVELAPPQPSPMPDKTSCLAAVGGDEEVVVPQSDDVAVAIEVAERQIRRFQRTQSERLRREIGVRPQAEFRRSESENRRKSVSSVDESITSDMERLSSEEFRRRVDAFIGKHWSKKTIKQKRFQEYI
ncbi:hypothetical protein CASFOL_017042 [Castilleja foliolosa]|uniref:DUF4408 domain-containing protein n=1 Tax=Castilleja foliolosa TaxID=1961234 RepID=A0ABD3D9Y1_9LAMI